MSSFRFANNNGNYLNMKYINQCPIISLQKGKILEREMEFIAESLGGKKEFIEAMSFNNWSIK